jgi:hypothetical protein
MGVLGLFPEDRWIRQADVSKICDAKLETDFYFSKYFPDFLGMILVRGRDV